MIKRKNKYATGGRIEGPSHEEGGVMLTQDGQPSAEVEGGERIFSVEDTEKIEQMASAIQSGSEDADQLAMELGYEVTRMVTKQDKKQGGEQEMSDDEFLAQASAAEMNGTNAMV